MVPSLLNFSDVDPAKPRSDVQERRNDILVWTCLVRLSVPVGMVQLRKLRHLHRPNPSPRMDSDAKKKKGPRLI